MATDPVGRDNRRRRRWDPRPSRWEQPARDTDPRRETRLVPNAADTTRRWMRPPGPRQTVRHRPNSRRPDDASPSHPHSICERSWTRDPSEPPLFSLAAAQRALRSGRRERAPRPTLVPQRASISPTDRMGAHARATTVRRRAFIPAKLQSVLASCAAPTRPAAAVRPSLTRNTPPAVSTLDPTRHRATKALASVASAKSRQPTPLSASSLER